MKHKVCTRKSLSLVFAILLIVTLFTIMTSAESATVLSGTMEVTNDLTLNGPVTAEGDATLNVAAGVTLDLGTYNITVPSGAKLTIKGEGTVTSTSSAATVTVEKGGALVLESGTVENTATDGNSIDVYGTFTMIGGKAISTFYDSVCIRAGGNGDISGGEVISEGGQGIKVLSSSLEGTAGTLTVSGTAKITALESAIFDNAGTGNPRPVITLKGGTYIRTGGAEAYENYKYVLYSGSGRATWKIYKATLINDASTKWGNYNTVGDFFNTSGTSNGDGTYTLEASATYYDLWVGGVQVNNVDKNDIFGDGTVSYNVNTNTLYLEDANITTLNYDLDDYFGATLNYAEEESVIFSALPSLTIRYYGTNTLGGNIGTYADEGTATVTLTGPDVTDTLTVGAVEADALTVDGKGTVTATAAAGGANYCGVYALDITVKDGAILIASSEYAYTPTAMGFGTMNAEGYIATNENGEALTIVDLMGSGYLYVKGDQLANDFSNIASYVKLAPASTFYVQVGGVQVTDDNADDILGDGKASFDAATNTLTISGDMSTSGSGVEVVNYTGTDTLNILVTENAAFTTAQSTVIDALDGKIKLTIADGKTLSLTAGAYYAIRAKGIEIVGGNLFATTTDDSGYYVIIGTDDGILIKDSNVEVTSSVTDVHCLAAYENGDIIIDNSTVKAIANGDIWMGGVYGISVYAQSHGNLIIKNGSKVYATGASAGVYVGSSVEAEGFTITASTTAETDETACTETPTLSNNYYYIGEEKAKTVVIAPPSAPPHTHYICGEETCAGHPDGTTHSQTVTFDKALSMTADGVLYINGVEQTTSSNTYTLPSGNYYLTADCAKAADLDKYRYIEIPAGAVVNLCLCDSTFSVYDLTVKGTLNLCSCGADGNIDGRFAGIRANGGTVTAYSGTVVGNNAALEVKSGGTATVYDGSFTSATSYAVKVNQAKLTIYDGSFTTTSTSLEQGALSITAAGTATDVDVLGGNFVSTNDVIRLEDNHSSAADDHTSALQISGGTFRTTSTGHKVLYIITNGGNTPYCNITGENVLTADVVWFNEAGNEKVDPTAVQYAKVTVPPLYTGTGTESDPYVVSTEAGLRAVLELTDNAVNYIKLNADITDVTSNIFHERSHTPIVLDMNFKSLSFTTGRLYLNGEATVKNGTVSTIDNDAAIALYGNKNVVLDNMIISAESMAHVRQTNGTLTMTNSTLSGNAQYGLLLQGGTATVSNVSISAHAYAYWVTAATPLKLDSRPVTGYADTATYVSASTDVSDLQAELDQLKRDLADAQTALQEAIDKKASSEELTKAIEDLTAAYAAADEGLKKLLGDEIDADVKALKDSLETQLAATDKALADAITKAENDLANAKTDLQAAIDKKASSEELTKAIADLTTAYEAADTALQAAIETKMTTDLSTLKTALEGDIKTVTENIAKVEKALADAKTDLQNKIDQKADATALADAITDLTTAYEAADDTLKSLLQAEIDADVKVLQDALEKQLASTEKTLTEAIAKVEKDLADAKTDLQNKIDQKADATALADAITDLTTAYEAADDTLKSLLQAEIDADVKVLQDALEKQLASTEKTLTEAIAKVEKDLADAKTDLQNKIDQKADATALADAITDLTTAYEAADDTLKSLLQAEIDADVLVLKNDLEGQLNAAKGTLETAIAKVEKDLADAKTDLQNKIDQKANASDVADALNDLTNAYVAADNALKSYLMSEIATNMGIVKTDLEAQLAEAKTALETAIKTAEGNLDKAVTDLETAIKNGDTALDEKILALDAAYKTADTLMKGAITADLEANIAALRSAMDEADTQMKEAIEALQAELDAKLAALEAKLAGEDDALSSRITTILTILIITDVIVVGVAAFMFIGKKS